MGILAAHPSPVGQRGSRDKDGTGQVRLERRHHHDLLNEAASKAPLGELIDIMDVGWTCAYLATPFAHRLTGDTVYIDSGASIVA